MKRYKIWLTGSKGRLGSALKKRLHQEHGVYVLETDLDLDISDGEAVQEFMDRNVPNLIINCASLTDGNACEASPIDAYRVNAVGARNLADAARAHDVGIIQLSTDDVFEGSKGEAFNEFDQPVPRSVYAKSKLAGETLVREINPRHTIVRSSWVYNPAVQDDSFYHQVLQKGKKQEAVVVESGSFSTPTSADALAGQILELIQHKKYGTYHISDQGCISRADYAREILRKHGLNPDLVQVVPGAGTSTVLTNMMSEIEGLPAMPDWKEDFACNG